MSVSHSSVYRILSHIAQLSYTQDVTCQFRITYKDPEGGARIITVQDLLDFSTMPRRTLSPSQYQDVVTAFGEIVSLCANMECDFDFNWCWSPAPVQPGILVAAKTLRVYINTPTGGQSQTFGYGGQPMPFNMPFQTGMRGNVPPGGQFGMYPGYLQQQPQMSPRPSDFEQRGHIPPQFNPGENK